MEDRERAGGSKTALLRDIWMAAHKFHLFSIPVSPSNKKDTNKLDSIDASSTWWNVGKIEPVMDFYLNTTKI